MHLPLGPSAVDLLDADPRPSFIVEPFSSSSSPLVIYRNPALSSNSSLLEILELPIETHSHLWEWITGPLAPTSSPARHPTSSSLSYLNFFWTRIVVAQRWIVVGANEQSPPPESPREIPLDRNWDNSVAPTNSSEADTMNTIPPSILSSVPTPTPPLLTHPHLDRRAKSTPGILGAGLLTDLPSPPPAAPAPGPDALQSLRRATTDPGWILPEIMPEQTPFLDVINSVDWNSTPLGPMARWPPRLQQTFNQILADSRSIAIYWGKHYTTIYNEAFSKLCGSKHPALLGQTVEDAWPDAGKRLKETMQTSAQKQRASVEDEWCFFVEKTDDPPEETYLKWSIIPINEGGECFGFMHPVLDTTSMRLWERRMKMLINLGEVLVTARDVKSYWEKTIEELEAVEPRYDIPLAILYSVEDSLDSQPDSTYDTAKICRFEGAIGVPAGHAMIPPTMFLRNSEEGLSAAFREALTVQYPFVIQTRDDSLPEHLLEGLEWRGFGDPCRAAVICPIRPTREESVMGLLFLGLNPRRPYDNDYRQYISLLSQKLTTSLASTVLLEEEARRGRNAAEQAAYDQAMLKEKLDFQTKEATESIQKFEAVAEFIPVGMAFGDNQGNITFANDAWYRITGYPHDGPVASGGFLSCVVEEDQQNVTRAYEQLQSSNNVTFEFRVNGVGPTQLTPAPSTSTSPSFEKAGLDLVRVDSYRASRHVLASARAERAPDGSTIRRVLTCLTDVTLHKQTADEAVRRAQQAENLKRMAELATVGMYDMDMDGRLVGANNVFFEMCGLERVDLGRVAVKPWETCVVDEDLGILREALSKLVSDGRPQTAEIRFKTPWIAEDGAKNKISAPRWVQATLMPVRNSGGVIQSFTGCLSDVSLQKWQLEREKQRKEEAIESKRQQENFIDMTSHEMRNPLSAIIHCADAVIGTLARVLEICSDRLESAGKKSLTRSASASALQQEMETLISNSIDNAETIVECSKHQKRIVDDILTMSKLDSKLLAVTPITVDPIRIVRDALKMFEMEARRVDIDLSMVVDRSFQDLRINYLDFDPSRLKQVLINLLTNALKFTKSGPTRNVSVTICASLTRPTDRTSSVQFIPRSKEAEDDDYDQPALRNRGPPIFLLFEVKDTGQGLSEEEKKSLFQRFVQASSRTHVKYGGSGLGLFISRRLTELQQGAIGVASQPGVGSTFAFYIETYQPSEASLREAEASTKAATEALMLTANGFFNSSSLAKQSPTSSSSVITSARAQNLGLADALQINGILIVEDNLINQQITRRGLSDRGFVVDVANHGVEALDKLKLTDRYIPDENDEPPSSPFSTGDSNGTGAKKPIFRLSMILMDIEMPVQDGLTCTRHIRDLEARGRIRGSRLPIIAVSANARMEQILEAKAAGCDDVLVKPYRMPELIEKMRIVVGMMRAGEARDGRKASGGCGGRGGDE